MAAPTRKELAKAILAKMDLSKDDQKLAKAIALYLSEHRMSKDLDGLMRDIASLRADNGTLEVNVTSAFPLTASLKRDIRSFVAKQSKSKEVIFVETIDPRVLGGLRIETGEQQLDATVQAKLNRLKRAIV